nr:phosphoribosylglycinamide formyltransferase [Quercus suber]
MASTKITILISGSGTNLQALIDALNTPDLPSSQIVRVISDRKDAYGLQRAKTAGIPTTYHGILPYKKKFPSDGATPDPEFKHAREAYDADLAQLILADTPQIVVCAGFMRIVTPSFLSPLSQSQVPVINLHPSLHGDLVGAHCIERAWDEFEQGKRTKTGCMVHYVVEEVDTGELILQREVDMVGCGSIDDLRKKLSAVEHKIIVEGSKTAIARLSG